MSGESYPRYREGRAEWFKVTAILVTVVLVVVFAVVATGFGIAQSTSDGSCGSSLCAPQTDGGRP